MRSRRVAALLTLVLIAAGCGGDQQDTPTLGDLDCANGFVTTPFERDSSVSGFENPQDALSILSWDLGTPRVESTGTAEVVFVFLDNDSRVGRAVVVSVASGWVVSEVEFCQE